MESLRKDCLVVLNIGDRPFLRYTMCYFERYCAKNSLDFRVVTQYSLPLRLRLPIFLNRSKRKNIGAFFQKFRSIQELLEKYEKIIVMDDTSIVSDATPDVTKLVSANELGVVPEDGMDVQSHKIDRPFLKRLRDVDIDTYVHGGFLVVPRKFREIFSDRNLYENSDLLFKGRYPCQAYLNYMIQSRRLPLRILDYRFNEMHLIDYHKSTERERTALPTKHLEAKAREAYIHHITGYYKHRLAIVQQICAYLTSMNQISVSDIGVPKPNLANSPQSMF